MLNLQLRDEFQGSQMPGTVITLRRSDNKGAVQEAPNRVLDITYPTADVQTALRALSVFREKRPIVLMGDRGRGKSHIMAVMHHAIQHTEQVQTWARSWGTELNIPWLSEISLSSGFVAITEPVHNHEYPLLWDLLFDRHPHGQLYKGKFQQMERPFPPRSLLEEMFESQPVALILDEFQKWFDGLHDEPETTGRKWRVSASNFIQNLSEIAKDRPDILILVVSILNNSTDAFGQIHRNGPTLIDFRGPTAKQDRQRLLLHRLFRNRQNISVSAIESLVAAYAQERFRLRYAHLSEAERSRITSEVIDSWPFSPELLELLEDQILMAPAAQESRDLIRILAQVFRVRGELAPVITPADFFVNDDAYGVQSLLDSIAGFGEQEKLRQVAQRNLEAVRSAGMNVVHDQELISALWMRSMSPGNIRGGSRQDLHLDITREEAIDDNAYISELTLLIENSVNIHGEESTNSRLYFDLHDNPRSKVRATARNLKLWDANAPTNVAGQITYPGKDVEHIRDTVKHLLIPETRQTTGKVVVLGPRWQEDPWCDIPETDQPQKWDCPVLLVIPTTVKVQPGQSIPELGEWLARHVGARRNTVRFLLPAADANASRLNGGDPRTGDTPTGGKCSIPRQLLVHTQLLRAIANASNELWPLDVREQALGAFQQYLRNQNMFAFWNLQRDTPEPMFSNPNYHPKQQLVENCVFSELGRGNWKSSADKVVDGISWLREPWELVVGRSSGVAKSTKVEPQDPVLIEQTSFCQSSTDLSTLNQSEFDFIITDPPFGNNLFYADLADFFYVWLRIPLLHWYQGLHEQAYFEPEFTPKALEAIKNPAEHPDDRELWEKDRKIRANYLELIQSHANDATLKLGDLNPLFRPEPAEDFYQQTLSACWAEAGKLLKPGGTMAFTFHHNEDEAWVNVLEALFDAGYLLVATYPIRSDETKGSAANAAFGSKKIEYDIIHICRKQLETPQPVSWARMRRWVKEEVGRLKELLEHSHGKFLPEADLRVIMRGKALEFYSRHYGQVYTGEGQILSVREALLGINLILDDLAEESSQVRPPETAEPQTRLFLRIFIDRNSIPRDELHKTLRGTGFSQGDLEDHGWIRATGTTIHLVPIEERFGYFITPGRNRKVIKTDLDQAYFLIGAAIKGSGINIDDELNRKTFSLKNSTDALLQWYAERGANQVIQDAARLALNLVTNWRTARSKQVESLNKQLQLSLWETIELEEMVYA